MRRLFVLLALLTLSAASYAHERERFIDGDGCARSHYRFNGRRAFVTEETIEAGNLRSLNVTTKNSPLKVSGGNGGGYTITVCKAAELEADLAQIKVSVEN